jgi:hypothetical protein
MTIEYKHEVLKGEQSVTEDGENMGETRDRFDGYQ